MCSRLPAEASSSQTTACWTAKETLGVQYGHKTQLDEERRASFNRIYFDDLKQSSFLSVRTYRMLLVSSKGCSHEHLLH